MDASLIHILVKGLVDGFSYDNNECVMDAARLYYSIRLLSRDFKTSLDYWLMPLRAKNRLVLFISEDHEDVCEDYYTLPNGLMNGEYSMMRPCGLWTKAFYLSDELLLFNRSGTSGNAPLYGCGGKDVAFRDKQPVSLEIPTDYGFVFYNHDTGVFTVDVMFGDHDIDIMERERVYGYKLEISMWKISIKIRYKESYIYTLAKDKLVYECLQVIRNTRDAHIIRCSFRKIAKKYDWAFDTECDLTLWDDIWTNYYCECEECGMNLSESSEESLE